MTIIAPRIRGQGTYESTSEKTHAWKEPSGRDSNERPPPAFDGIQEGPEAEPGEDAAAAAASFSSSSSSSSPPSDVGGATFSLEKSHRNTSGALGHRSSATTSKSSRNLRK